MMKVSRRISKPGTTHLYELTVIVGGQSVCWAIEANTRSQAGATAKREGATEVCDCNMVG